MTTITLAGISVAGQAESELGVGLAGPAEVATREALEQMATGLYTTLLQATFFPARVMMRLARTTWKIFPGKPPAPPDG